MKIYINVFPSERMFDMVKSSLEVHKKAEQAMREAVYKVVKEHRKTGVPLAVWKNGKVVRVPAKKIKCN